VTERLTADICIIGAGSAGLSVAAGAAQMGARTVLVEKDKMGGECLNTGCVPSKSLLASAHAAAEGRRSGALGIPTAAPYISGWRVRGHLQSVIEAIAPNDSVARLESLGVSVLRAAARFIGPREIAAGDTIVRARRFVVATGSSPAIPLIPGIESVPYLTNETLFELTVIPEHLIVIGGGPIGVEMAQAYRRLRARVTLFETATILPRDDPELVAVVRGRLIEDGVDLRERATVKRIDGNPGRYAVSYEIDGQPRRIEGTHLLVATGRQPKVIGLGLTEADILYTPKGIHVDARLRTSNRRVFAIGDVIGSYRFTHVATYHASVVIKNALFRWPAKADLRVIPWVTFTDPELAQVGLNEAEATAQRVPHRVLRWSYRDNDRAQAERRTEGLVKIIVSRRGDILGATIVGAAAGELIQLWVLAMSQRLRIGSIAKMIAPYPTLGEISKRVAGSFYTPSLFSPRTRRIVRLLAKLG
jgi:pyruvate/2-oxoglutarate dehydrogenase complex dihydrolipoamide dehydrogenase (E3) component